MKKKPVFNYKASAILVFFAILSVAMLPLAMGMRFYSSGTQFVLIFLTVAALDFALMMYMCWEPQDPEKGKSLKIFCKETEILYALQAIFIMLVLLSIFIGIPLLLIFVPNWANLDGWGGGLMQLFGLAFLYLLFSGMMNSGKK